MAFRCLNGTVGVAPGSYTLQLGAPPCVDDINGPVAYGQPMRGWYDSATATYLSYFAPPPPPMMPATAGPSVLLDPYGTDSQLKGLRGLRDALTIGGVRVDLLALVGTLALGIGLAIHHFTKH